MTVPLDVATRRRAMEVRHPVWRETTLDVYLDRAAADFGDRPLVLTDRETLSYGDVVRQSRRIAGGLWASGIRSGDRVAMVMANYPVTVPLLFAIWRLGAVAVPLNTLYRAEEMEFALAEAGCAFLVVMSRFGSRCFENEMDTRLPGWRTGACRQLPELKGALVFDEDHPDAFFEGLPVGRAPDGTAGAHDAAVIMFTSGTTGLPKGVVQTHDNLLRAAYAGAYHQAFQEGRRAVFSLPLYHAFGLVVGLLSGLVVGGSIVPLLRFDADAILTATARHGATYLMGVPTMTIALLRQAKAKSYDLSSLSAIHSAAAPTPSWVWREIQEVFGCQEIFTSYGQTETTATIVCTRPGDPIDIVSSTQGAIVEAGVAGIAELGGRICEFKTVDPATGDDLPEGMTGELCTKGPLNSQGYFRRPEETARLFLPGGWLRTGDLGQFRPDGNLFLTGRAKELYKSRGELVSPKELEQVLTAHPAISQAFLIGMPDDEWGECGCAWIVREGGHAITEEEVLSYLSERVARYKLPRDVWFIEEAELPKTGTGKIQKNKLKDIALAMLAGEPRG